MKRALFLDRNAKTASASPARTRQLRELTGVLFACHKDLTLQSGDLTQGDTCTVPVTMTTWPTLSFTKTPASLSLCCVCVCVIPDHLFRWSCREVSGCKTHFRDTVSGRVQSEERRMVSGFSESLVWCWCSPSLTDQQWHKFQNDEVFLKEKFTSRSKMYG